MCVSVPGLNVPSAMRTIMDASSCHCVVPSSDSSYGFYFGLLVAIGYMVVANRVPSFLYIGRQHSTSHAHIPMNVNVIGIIYLGRL